MPTKKQIKDCYEMYRLEKDWWALFFDEMSGAQILSVIGAEYHALIAYTDPRQMSYAELMFCRMVQNFPSAWKAEIYVEDEWAQFAIFLQSEWQQPLNPMDARCYWERPKRISLKVACPSCGKQLFPSRSKKFYYRAGGQTSVINVCKPCLKNLVAKDYGEKQVNMILANLAGHEVGKPISRTMQVAIMPKLPMKSQFVEDYDGEMRVIPGKNSKNWQIYSIYCKYPNQHSDFAAKSPI